MHDTGSLPLLPGRAPPWRPPLAPTRHGAHLAGLRKPAPWVLGTICSLFTLPRFGIHTEILGGRCLWGQGEGGAGSLDLHSC